MVAERGSQEPPLDSGTGATAAEDDQRADVRDHEAEAADVKASGRDTAARGRDAVAEARDRLADDRQEPTPSRATAQRHAAEDRESAAEDRAMAGSDRSSSADNRHQAAGDRADAAQSIAALKRLLSQAQGNSDGLLLIERAQIILKAKYGLNSGESLLELAAQAARDRIDLRGAAGRVVDKHR